MRLMPPSTSAPLFFLISAERRDIHFNQFNYPTLSVASVNNRATDNAVIQSVTADQPTWSSNAIQGAYSWQNNPGAGGASPPGRAGFIFAGSQFFEYDALASSFAGAEDPMTIVAVVDGSTSGVICSFGSTAGAPPTLELSYTGTNISFAEHNGSGTFTASAAMDGYTHVVTAVRANGSVTVRVDGTQVATTPVTAGTEAFNTFVVGGVNSSGTATPSFVGNLGCLAIYGNNGAGMADVLKVETYLQLQFGQARGGSY